MTIFISHITEEKETAIVLKSWLESIFLGNVNVFVSSEPSDIKAGERWLSKIEEALDNSKCLLVLCSLQSVNRPWINFETGAAWIRKIPVIPICHTGINKYNLPMPLSLFQALKVTESNFSRKLVRSLIDHLGYSKLPKITFEEFDNEIIDSTKGKDKNLISTGDEDVEDLGLLDHIVIVDEGFSKLTDILNNVTVATENVTKETNETHQKFELSKNDTSQGASKHRQRIAKDFAKPMHDYHEKLNEVNKTYSVELYNIRKGLNFVLNFDYEMDDESVAELDKLYDEISLLHTSTINAVSTFNGMKSILDDFPKVQRHLNKSVRESSQEVGNFIENLHNTLDLLHKTQVMIKSLLSRTT